MPLLILLTAWLLFVLPILIMLAMTHGARLYAMGQHQQVPTLVPKFAVSRGGQAKNGERERELLPRV